MGITNTFYIVRHGETEHNINGMAQGHTDSPLTPDGLKQASDLARIFKDIQFDVAFASDLSRAYKTAEIILSGRGISVSTSKLLRERNYGKYDGGPSRIFKEENKEMLEKTKILPKQERRKMKLAPDIESDDEITGRLITFLDNTAKDHNDKTILITAHGGIMRAFLNHLEWNGKEDLKAGAIKNTGYIKLTTDGPNFIIEEVVGVER